MSNPPCYAQIKKHEPNPRHRRHQPHPSVQSLTPPELPQEDAKDTRNPIIPQAFVFSALFRGCSCNRPWNPGSSRQFAVIRGNSRLKKLRRNAPPELRCPRKGGPSNRGTAWPTAAGYLRCSVWQTSGAILNRRKRRKQTSCVGRLFPPLQATPDQGTG